MTLLPEQPTTCRRLAIAVRGIVQGVGFRPFVYNTARAQGLSGWVQNTAGTVQIEVEGAADAVAAFLETLRDHHPPQARIDAMEVSEIACDDGRAEPAAREFEIRTSGGPASPRPTIPADLATCRECLAEIRDPAERRYGYPFTNCTNCGPRWSLIRQLPYDRPRTSMAEFTMCPACRAEYDNPTDRRFHAQPIACPACGPALQLLDAKGREVATGDAALTAAGEAVLAGQVVAMKGLGGFQLLADATSSTAVAVLRERKRRPDRPLALMFPTLDDVRQCCEVSDEEAHALASHQAPILLLRRVGQGRGDSISPIGPMSPVGPILDQGRENLQIANNVAPGNPYLGAMLPYTPLHHLLMAAIGRPIVCTSGNISEEPMAITTEDALKRLGPIADVLLTHNRPIVRPVDDSVARVGPDGVQVLRRARGYAPLPIELPLGGPRILAVGGHLKNTVAVAVGGPAGPSPVVLSPHVGDLDNLLSVEVFRRAIADLLEFFQMTPEVVACDLHPDYASTRHAETLAERWGVPLVRVQHHHAHVAACLAEHGIEGPVLGLAWDGTGYGSDGTIWGGEALLCHRGEFHRVAHLRTFALPGGDRAIRQPRRSALAVLYEIMGDEAARAVGDWFTEVELRTITTMLARGLQSPRTSSMGRLFDAVAALVGLPRVITFEGQAAMALEFAADPDEQEAYPLPLVGRVGQGREETIGPMDPISPIGPMGPIGPIPTLPSIADWEPLVRAVLADRAAGVPVGRISARFHNALADLALAIARHAGVNQVALTGGCFQNGLLAERVRSRLLAAGFTVFTHRQVPPGDGGIALGQVFVATHLHQGPLHVPGNPR